MQRKTVDLWVGVFVVAGLLALAMLAFKVGNLSGGDLTNGYKITAQFDNIGGLTVKAPVTMAGVRIGRVTDIRIDRNDYTAVVELSIGAEHDNLPSDTSAAILTAGLLGAQYVGLEPGGEDAHLKEGDEISFTQSAVILEHLIGQLVFSQAQGGTDE